LECGGLPPLSYAKLASRDEGGSKPPHSKNGGKSMSNVKRLSVLTTILLAGFLVGIASAQDAKITVLNPRGILPPIKRIPMSPRMANLDGKTIYVVDTRYPRTREFMEELVKLLKERYPKTSWILRDKFGGYVDDDPKLWAEVKEKGHGIVMGVGH
jgi:hypothetical protein